MSGESRVVAVTVFLCVAASLLLPSCGRKQEVLPAEEQPAEVGTGAVEEKREPVEKKAVAEDFKRLKELEAELVEDLEMLKATLAARERELAAREAGLRSRVANLEMREAEIVRKHEAAGRLQVVSYVVLALGVILILAALVMVAKERRRKASVRAPVDKDRTTNVVPERRSEK